MPDFMKLLETIKTKTGVLSGIRSKKFSIAVISMLVCYTIANRLIDVDVWPAVVLFGIGTLPIVAYVLSQSAVDKSQYEAVGMVGLEATYTKGKKEPPVTEPEKGKE